MKTTKSIFMVALIGLAFTSCKKNECAMCHYDAADGSEVELGEKCGDDLESLENSGYSDGSATYTVHCGEDH